MKPAHLALALFWLAPLAGWALEIPTPSPRDPTIRTQLYRSDSRIQVIGTMRRSTTITFGTDESVTRVIFGDDEIWDGPDATTLGNAPLRNHLPLWPKKAGKTNLQVITSRPGQPDRIYQFMTEVREARPDGSDDPDACYGLTFTYGPPARPPAVLPAVVETSTGAAPAPRAPRMPTPAQVEAQARRELDAKFALARADANREFGMAPVSEQVERRFLNYRYVARGDRTIAPTAVFSGYAGMFLRFPEGQQQPSIFVVQQDGTEWAPNWIVRHGFVVVRDVYVQLRLRLGSSVVDILNVDRAGGAPADAVPLNGTTDPDVRRELRR